MMDYSPFYEVNLEEVNDADLEMLKIINKDTYSSDKLVSFGENSMYLSKL